MKSITTVEVLLAGTPVGELVGSRQGIYFAYHPQWVAQGFNLRIDRFIKSRQRSPSVSIFRVS